MKGFSQGLPRYDPGCVFRSCCANFSHRAFAALMWALSALLSSQMVSEPRKQLALIRNGFVSVASSLFVTMACMNFFFPWCALLVWRSCQLSRGATRTPRIFPRITCRASFEERPHVGAQGRSVPRLVCLPSPAVTLRRFRTPPTPALLQSPRRTSQFAFVWQQSFALSLQRFYTIALALSKIRT